MSWDASRPAHLFNHCHPGNQRCSEQHSLTPFNGNGPVQQESNYNKPLCEDVVGEVKTPLSVLPGSRELLTGDSASLNLSNLLVARSAARSKEMAIRSALGSTRWVCLIRQQVTESLLIWVAVERLLGCCVRRQRLAG